MPRTTSVLAVGIMAHFYRVRGVVSTDAVDAPNRKESIFSGDRDRHDGWRFDSVVRHAFLRKTSI